MSIFFIIIVSFTCKITKKQSKFGRLYLLGFEEGTHVFILRCTIHKLCVCVGFTQERGNLSMQRETNS